MPNPTELIAQAASKKDAISAATKGKADALTAYNIAAGSATNQAGLVSADSTERDLRTLNPSQLYGKYGDRATELIANQARGDAAFARDASGTRTDGQAAADTVSSIGMGIANSFGGIAALGAGVFDADAGRWASDQLKSLNDFGQSTQSKALQDRRKSIAARNQMINRDNAHTFAQEAATDGTFMATLQREGRNALGTLGTAIADPMILQDGTSSGIGSLLAGGPVAKTIGALGVGAKAAMPLAIGAMEGGGAYAQTNQDVAAMSHEKLLESSPNYVAALREGLSQEQAKARVANRSALMAAAIQAPIGVATGKLVSKFEGSPLVAGSLKDVAGNIIRETVEEGAQSLAGKFNQNLGTKTFADTKKDLGEGLGEETALGALYGAGTAGALQAPKASLLGSAEGAKLAWEVTKAVGSKSTNWALNQADKLQTNNDKASPIAGNVLVKEADTIINEPVENIAVVKKAIEDAPTTPEQKVEANAFVDAARASYKFDAATTEYPDTHKEILANTKNRTEAVMRMAQQVLKTKNQDQLIAAGTLYDLMGPMLDVQESDPEGLASIPADSPARAVLAGYAKVLGNIDKSPEIQKAFDVLTKMVNQTNGGIPAIAESDVDTGVAKGVVAVASLHPDKGNLATAQMVLKHAKEGRLNLSKMEQAALDASINLLKARQTIAEETKKLNLVTKSDMVSEQVLTGQDPARDSAKSAVQHTKRILSAMRSGNTTLAAAWLNDFGLFVENQQNKVNALNEHLFAGPKAPNVQYKQLQPGATRKWKMSTGGAYVTPTKVKHIQNAQTVNLETRILSDVFNGLVKTFPSLNVAPHSYEALDALLMGDANVVASEFQSGARNTGTKPKTEPIKKEVVRVEPSKLSDAALNDAIDLEKNAFQRKALVDEMTKREDVAIAEQAKEDARVTELTDVELESISDTKLDGLLKEPSSKKYAARLIAESLAREDTAVIEAKTELKQQKKVVIEEEPAEQAVVEKPSSPLAAVFPKLVKHVTNMFLESHSLPNKPNSRITGIESVMDTVRDAFTSNDKLASFIGSSATGSLNSNVIAAYKAHFSKTDARKVVAKNLATFLAQERNGVTVATMFARGKDIHRSNDGKVLNIVEPTDTGYAYNQELLDGAVLAGSQWLLDAPNIGGTLDDAAIEQITGLDIADVDADAQARLKAGSSLVQIKQSLATKVRAYWGLRANNSADMAYADGISEAVASELLRAYVQANLITVDVIKGNNKTINWYTVARLEEGNSIYSFPDAIDQAVLIEKESVFYVGEDIPKTPTTQMNNPEIDLTPDQLQGAINEGNTPYYIDMHMFSMYSAMGAEGLIHLFGAGNIKNKVMNVNDRASANGLNKSIDAAYKQAMAIQALLVNRAEMADTSVESMPMRWAYSVSKVGRQHMLGEQNPQASKAMREMMLPTWDTLDLSSENSEHYDAFSLALSQAFGIGIHKQSFKETTSKLAKMLSSATVAIDVVDEWMASSNTGSGNDIVDLGIAELTAIKGSMVASGIAVTPVALHALVEYVRLRRTSPDGRKAFKTSLYIEADGVTNGPINAMMLYASGQFDAEWLDNVSKGGMNFGSARTMQEHYSTDNVDLYRASIDAASKHLIGKVMEQSVLSTKAGREVTGMYKHMFILMNMMLPGVTYDDTKSFDNGALVLDRNAAKSPLTQTIYGAGAESISKGIAGSMMDGVYKKMTLLAANIALAKPLPTGEALFPGDADGAAKAIKFMDSLNALTGARVTFGKFGMYVKANEPSKEKPFYPELYKPSREEFESLTTNVATMFVKPLRKGIAEVIGESVIDNMKLIQTATNVQSIFLAQEFKDRIAKELAKKRKQLQAFVDSGATADPKLIAWRRGDFFSRNELFAVRKELVKKYPLVKNDSQAFYIAKSQAMPLTTTAYSRALDGSMQTPANTYAPVPAGVSGIAAITQGYGDAQMMQVKSLRNDMPGTIGIFDGMHIPLSKLKDYSQKINDAVRDTWKTNPVKDVLTMFESFAKNASVMSTRSVLRNQDVLDALADALFSKAELKELGPISYPDVLEALNHLGNTLTYQASEIEYRRKAVAAVPNSIDHMAGGSGPSISGTMPDAPMSQEDVLNELNEAYMEAAGVVPDIVDAEVHTLKSVKELFEQGNPTDEQKSVFSHLSRTKAIEDYSFVIGSAQAIKDHQESTGKQQVEFDIDPSVKGFVVVDDKTIYITDFSAETLVHEIIHATTLESVTDHYAGTRTNKETSDAIVRIEQMMDSFLEFDDGGSIGDAQAVVRKYKEDFNNQSKANAINEFMAWALSNNEIINKLKKTKLPLLVRLAKDVITAIKDIVWGKKLAPKVGTDFFTNLRFNVAIVARSPESTASQVRKSVLFHNTNFGNNQRLIDVRNAFALQITDYLQNPLEENGTATEKIYNDALVNTQAVMDEVQAQGFAMTGQEQSTFRMVVNALATEAQIDTNALAATQELFTHVVKNLSVESFMEDPASTNPADYYYAQQKYDVIVGKGVVRKDSKNRTTLLPVFLGLATVSGEFRNVLAKLSMPKNQVNKEKTLDALLENTGSKLMDKLSSRLSGQGNAINVKDAIDNLQKHIQQVVNDEQSFIDNFAAKSGGIVDSANDKVVAGLQKLSGMGMAYGTKLGTLKAKPARIAGNFIKAASAVISETSGEQVSEAVVSLMNRSNVWKPLAEFVSDLTGRTQSNASVYDMIKQTRAMISQLRQQFREGVPRIINSKFKRAITKAEWESLFKSMGKTDLASLIGSYSKADIFKIVSDKKELATAIANAETSLSSVDKRNWSTHQRKMKQLAGYMADGTYGNNLLRNANAVAHLFGENRVSLTPPTDKSIAEMDRLITLYALVNLNQKDQDTLSSLVQSEADGVSFTLDYLVGQRKGEQAKHTDATLFNSYKGYVPVSSKADRTLIVASDTEFSALRLKSFVRVGAYKGSSLDKYASTLAYYYAPVSARAAYNQGILQNVRATVFGVDANTGFSDNMMAGRITDPATVASMARRLSTEKGTSESLLPIYDASGSVVAFERAVDVIQTTRMEYGTNLAEQIGVWRGRQVEEKKAELVNQELIGKMYDMYRADAKISKDNNKMYVNLLAHTKDPVVLDAIRLFTKETIEHAESLFGADTFMVRKDMLNDAIGYRSATIGDAWTGNTRWSKETQAVVKNLATSVFGNKAYMYLTNTERAVQGFMAGARTAIVVKSVVVPITNFVSNILQLISRGVPITTITKLMPTKLAEIEAYTKSKLRQIELEAELRAATTNSVAERKLRVEIRSITDSHKRMSIWTLIEAGEFSTIADVGMTHEEVDLASGNLAKYIEAKVDKLPKGLRTFGKYGLVTKDTALFQGLQKSVQYGDFLAKAILFDDLTKRKGETTAYALGRITEEFVNYDKLTGRGRGYLENIGLLWFYNFKIRAAKVGLSMIRNNPLHTLLAAGIPLPSVLGSVGTPLDDNIITKGAEGTLGYSSGMGQAFRAPGLNPWYNLIN